MGFYDRDYQRGWQEEREPGFHLGASTSLTTKLVIVTCGVYLVQLLSGESGGWITRALSLNGDWYRQPWQAYQLLTYGFLHDPHDLRHIAFNMLGLWLFGREIEGRYGGREFLTFYLTSIVVAGLMWTMAEVLDSNFATMLGASGGVAAVVILFAFNFPHRTVLFMFFLPMPMWVVAVILVGFDVMGAMGRPGAGNVAYTAHLGGALFALWYYKSGIRLARWLPDQSWKIKMRRRPKLRVVDSDDDTTDNRVDDILRKIQQHGQDSLTRGEKRILEEASREYQKRRQ